jgi:hypothetical protein
MAVKVQDAASVVARFDTEADVLYISRGEPAAGYGEERAEGILLRWTYSNQQPSGVTVIGYRAHWRLRVRELAELVAAHLGVDWHAVKSQLEVT